MRLRLRSARLLAWLVSACALAAHAADTLHPWVVPAPRLVEEAYFSNLADGASIETPFLLKFGLTGIGLASIATPVPGTGHHHLLIDRELPLDFGQPLPFDNHYVHFGKGQMETVLLLPPGAYTLRLVLADNRHIPNFVYSKPLHVTVTKQNVGVDPKSLITRGVAILTPADGAAVKAPFRIGFHASGLNVSHIAAAEPGNGHFRLRVKPDGGHEEVINFDNGHTEAWLNPPSGRYTAQLELIDNMAPGKVLATSATVGFTVGH
jgi:hypothetical protein